ncbi:MAG: RidA family protein [Microbacterium sp.]
MTSQTASLPKPKGPYATTYRVGDVLYLSGQGSIDPVSGETVLGDIREQTTNTLANIEALLISEGFALADLAQVTCYLTNMADWPAMNEAYASYLGERAQPVRTAVEVAALPFGLNVEVTCIAHRKGSC